MRPNIQSCEIASDSYTAVKQASLSLFIRGETTVYTLFGKTRDLSAQEIDRDVPHSVRQGNERSISFNILLHWRLSFMRWRTYGHSA